MYEISGLVHIETPGDLSALAKNRRKQLAETQEELGLYTGYSYRLVLEFENGRPTVAFDKVLNLCTMLGIDLYARVRE